MLALSCAASGWVLQASSIPTSEYNYFVEDSVCEKVLPRFYEDTLLTWRAFGCEDVRTSVRRAFDEWQYNTPGIRFYEVADPSAAQMSVSAEYLSNTTLARWRSVDAIIEIDEGTCWYTDQSFCSGVIEHSTLIWSLLVFVWVITFGFGGYFVYSPARRGDILARVANWAVFISCPIVLFTAVLPCAVCYDFKYTMMHEIGHALGFGHTNETGLKQSCGCGANRTECTLTDERMMDSIMYNHIQHTASSCLSRDDVDGLRTIYGPANGCDTPAWCYRATSFTGHYRIAVALVYGFVLSWLFVLVRSSLYDRFCAHPVARHVQHVREVWTERVQVPQPQLPHEPRARSARSARRTRARV